MTREELIANVALKMDEISSSDDVIVSVNASDNNPLYTQINGFINESVNDVLTKAPIYRIKNQIEAMNLAPSDYAEETIIGTFRKKVVIDVPNDFIRLVSITDSLFQRPIVDLAVEGDNVDKQQHNKALVAKTAKPVAVIGRDIYGGRTISCYSYSATDTPAPNMIYVKRYDNSLDLSEDTGLDEYITDIVSWACAGKVFASRGDVNNGKICDENAMALMV